MPKPKGSVPIPDSKRQQLAHAQESGDVPTRQTFDVIIRLRPRNRLPSLQTLASQLPQHRRHLTREEYEANYGADPQDIRTVEAFAQRHSLSVEDSSIAEQSVTISGTADALGRAFQVKLKMYQHGKESYRDHKEVIHIPAELKDIVTGVFGLDNRPFARPHVRVKPTVHSHDTVSTGFHPTDLARLYNFPTNVTGRGQTIGIIELGGGFRSTELRTYFRQIGITPPQVVVASFPHSGVNRPSPDLHAPDNLDVEVMLDLEVAGAVAPGARLVVYFAPDASEKGFLRVIARAVHDKVSNPSILSISWGGPESAASKQLRDHFNQVLETAAHLGVTVCVAAGDNGSADFPLDDPQRPWDGHAHVDFPASSPFVLSCGGTLLKASGHTILSEVVWHSGHNEGTGGGISRFFRLPNYQAHAKVPRAKNPIGQVKRGVPDVAGNAAQESGYRVLCDGQQFPDPRHVPPLPPVGGTSAVAPLWAGLIALLNESLGTRVGFLNPLLYQLPTARGSFRDITTGDNGDYQAKPGWDPCTGLGTPNGLKLLESLKGS
jgi:kumamolisin